MPDPSRIGKVRKAMARIKLVSGQGRRAWGPGVRCH